MDCGGLFHESDRHRQLSASTLHAGILDPRLEIVVSRRMIGGRCANVELARWLSLLKTRVGQGPLVQQWALTSGAISDLRADKPERVSDLHLVHWPAAVDCVYVVCTSLIHLRSKGTHCEVDQC